jgi:5-oxoprolinase (ATP-hydrolysing) subunit A
MWDLNLDAGEDPVALSNGSEARLYALVTRVNIACGGHAGDESSMRQAVRLAREAGAVIGAHPSYPDREHFGRRTLSMAPEAVTRFVAEQVGLLKAICESEGGALIHVKPHGALYNACAGDEPLATAIAEGVRQIDSGLVLVGLAGSKCLGVWKRLGFAVLGEGFADRGYRADGTLVPRTEPGALITDPVVAASQAKRLLQSGKAQTVCVHGDNPAAEAILKTIRLGGG